MNDLVDFFIGIYLDIKDAMFFRKRKKEIALDKKLNQPSKQKLPPSTKVYIRTAILGVFLLLIYYVVFVLVLPKNKTKDRILAIEKELISQFEEKHIFPERLNAIFRNNPLESSILIDGWENAFVYEVLNDGLNYKLTSLGKDGVIDTNDDIVLRYKPVINKVEESKKTLVAPIIKDTIIYTNGYDFPVGKPDAKAYYNAQKFQENDHLGDDWNGVGGGNTDNGDAIYAIANGYVSFAEDIQGGWGNVIRIIHYNPNKTTVESLYAHCETVIVKAGQKVKKGDKIATIGTANGTYFAHLHLEIRNEINRPIGGGYSSDIDGYLDPTAYIKQNRE